MRFLVDAQLPKSLSDFFVSEGYDSLHTLQLPRSNETEDGELTEIADREKRILVTKDKDFFEKFLLSQISHKLLLVSTGNIQNDELLYLFKNELKQLQKLFEDSQVIEIDKERITVHS